MKKEELIVFWQIIILVLSIFSFAYIIYSSSTIVSAQASTTPSTASTASSTSSTTSVTSTTTSQQEDYQGDTGIRQVARVDIGFEEQASSTSLSCCIKTSDGATCQEGIATNNDAACPTGWIPSRCNQVSACQRGCCIDNDNGVCSPQSTKNSCEGGGGTWTNDPLCNINQCRKNCCLIGDGSYFVTEKECERLSQERGAQKNYVQVPNENACLLLSGLQKRGACVYEQGERGGQGATGDSGGAEGERLCKFTTKDECVNRIRGVFSENLLCSNQQLNASVQKQARTGCAEGLNEVYWFDSLGNRENIWEGNFQAQKNSSWNNGIIKPKGESCNPLSSSNSGSSSNAPNCGNCQLLQSSCAINSQSGQAYCRSLNCKEAPANVGTQDRINGESWCVYEGQVGEGKDIPGSQHYVYYCNQGEVRSETCGDYRTAVCNENKVKIQNSTKEFSQARCRPNLAAECLKYNSIKDQNKKRQQCVKNSDCTLERFDFGKGYKFSVCLPQYPKGFDTTTDEGKKEARVMCKQANFECTKIMEKKIGGWECVAGCDCDTAEFTNQMTEWCTSLGDCGASVNTENKFTSGGYKVSNAPKITQQKTSQLKSYAKPKKNEVIKTSNYTIELLEKYYGWKFGSSSGDGSGSGGGPLGPLGNVVTGIGAVGMIAGIMSTEAPASLSFLGVVPASWAPALSAIGYAALGAAIGAAVGTLVAKAFGLSNQGATIVTAVGLAVGTVIAIKILAGGCAAFGPLGCAAAAIILIIVVVIVAILTKVFGIGDVKETKVNFTCKLWQAPKGGADCEKCDDNLLQPCTKYKCSALGTACEYINEGSEKPECVNIAPNDNTAPVITPWRQGLTQGYKYDIVSGNTNSNKAVLRTQNSECIPEFAPITISLNTDEYAQCAYSNEPVASTDLSEYTEYFNEEESFTTNHNLTIDIPSARAMAYEILGNLQSTNRVSIAQLEQQINEQYNNINYFVRCQDRAGNPNPEEFVINTCVKPSPDIMPPAISMESPASGRSVAYGQSTLNVTFYLNEPAECRWSNAAGKNYSSMENNMTCRTKVADVGSFGWECRTTFTGLNNSDKELYVKCLDQPWLKGTEKENERKAMTEDFIYSIKATKNVLKIDEVTPLNNSVILGGKEPFTLTSTIKTSGGVDNGKAQCEYSFSQSSVSDGAYADDYFNTFSSSHSNTWDLMMRGNYTLYLQCIDSVGNTATSQTSFTLELDTRAPVVTRAFNAAGSLTIMTDEDSECAYATSASTADTCDFIFNSANATRMLGVNKAHTTEWVKERTYFVRCIDKYQNPATGCSIIVKVY